MLRGGLDYTRQITTTKASVVECVMPDWFPHLAKDVMVFCNQFQHFGVAWGEQDSTDPRVIHIHTSRGGVDNLIITANRKDFGSVDCEQAVEFTPTIPPQIPTPL